MREWVVLLEAAGDGTHEPLEGTDVRELQRLLDRGRPAGILHCDKRYALQVMAFAANPVDALLDVVGRWTDAVRRLALPTWTLVRTEVFTPEELAREYESAERDERDVDVHSDATEGEHDEIGRELLRRAFSDPLTGLLGRAAFLERLEARRAASGEPAEAAVICLDLDDFRGVNSRFGAAIADAVLVILGERLTAMLRSGDVIARLGGDEFGILLKDSTPYDAVAVAQRMLRAVARRLTVGGQELTLSASAGVAVGRPGDPHTLLADAEAALRTAKAAGGGLVHYGPDASSPTPARDAFATAALQDRLAHLHLIQYAAVAANEAETLREAARAVLRQVCTQAGCGLGHLSILSPSEDVPETPLWHMADADIDRGLQVAAERLLHCPGGLLARVATTGRGAWIGQIAADSGDAQGDVTAAGLTSAFAFPVVVGMEVVAVLAFFSRTRIEPTGSFDDVLAGIGTLLGRVVERERAATALRRSAERLAASEAQLRDAQGMAGLGSWYFDLRNGTSSWSGMHELFGLPPGEPLALDAVLAHIHPDDDSRVRSALSRLVETGRRTAEEFRVLRADGQIRWHRSQGQGIEDEHGDVVAIHGTAQDITSAKQVEQDLRSAKELYQRIVERTHEGIMTVDTCNFITFVNARMAEMLGYSVEEMTGMPATDLLAPESSAGMAGRNRRRREGLAEHYQATLTCKDGAVVRVLVSASPLLDETGRYAGALAMVTDVSAVRDAEDILLSQSRRMQSELEGRDVDGAPATG